MQERSIHYKSENHENAFKLARNATKKPYTNSIVLEDSTAMKAWVLVAYLVVCVFKKASWKSN